MVTKLKKSTRSASKSTKASTSRSRSASKSTKAKASTSKGKTTRGGTSEQHARAGRLGGLAPHVCRGSECTKMRSKAGSRSTRATKSLKEGVLSGLLGKSKKTVTKKTATKGKSAASSKGRSLASRAKARNHEAILSDLFGNKNRKRTTAKRATSSRSGSKAASRTKKSTRSSAHGHSTRKSAKSVAASRSNSRSKKGGSITDMLKNLF